ncbi:MAG: DMT family transporter [Candidatus Thorarchaeota archaeon]
MKKSTLAYVAILLVTILWASSLILAKIVFTEMTPIIFVALRYSIAAPFLVLLVIASRERSRRLRNIRTDWRVLALAGITGPFLSQVLQYIGLSMTSASETLLLINMSPVFAVILAAPLINERITIDKVGGLLLATLGGSLIVIGGRSLDFGLEPIRILGDVIIILSTFLFAVNGIAGKVAIRAVDSVSVTAASTLIAVPFIWISAAMLEDLTILAQLSVEAWIIVLWVGFVNSVIAFILYYESMKYIEASRVQIALNLISVWGVMMSVLVLSEAITILQIFGGTLTIIGVIIAQRYADTGTETTTNPAHDVSNPSDT